MSEREVSLEEMWAAIRINYPEAFQDPSGPIWRTRRLSGAMERLDLIYGPLGESVFDAYVKVKLQPTPAPPQVIRCANCKKALGTSTKPFIRLDDGTTYCGNNCQWIGEGSPYAEPAPPSSESEKRLEAKLNHYVDVGNGAQMSFPTAGLGYQMRYGKNPNFAAASALDSYRYLVLECTKENAWRRILCIREALNASRAAQPESKLSDTAQPPLCVHCGKVKGVHYNGLGERFGCFNASTEYEPESKLPNPDVQTCSHGSVIGVRGGLREGQKVWLCKKCGAQVVFDMTTRKFSKLPQHEEGKA